MSFDWTIHVSDMVMILGFLYTLHRLVMTHRDFQRDVTRILKGEDGSNGLVGSVSKLNRDMYHNDGLIAKMRRALYGRRGYDQLSDPDHIS